MAIRQFSIKLDTNRQVFYPGETISGNVILDVNGAYNVKEIAIKFEGMFIDVLMIRRCYFSNSVP